MRFIPSLLAESYWKQYETVVVEPGYKAKLHQLKENESSTCCDKALFQISNQTIDMRVEKLYPCYKW